MKTHLIYNLGRRGFFSEINNMVLSKIYADRHELFFTVNSCYWNCRYEKGMRDYFENDINETNSFLSAQITRRNPSFRFKPFGLHMIFHNLTHLISLLYQLFHKNVVLGADIYEHIRSGEFLNSVSENVFLKELNDALRFSPSVMQRFSSQFNHLQIDEPFVGVHIRRGDKITTGEMSDIPLDRYIDEILQTRTNVVYVATDDVTCAEYIEAQLHNAGVKVFHNPCLSACGFSEGAFNHSGREYRYESTLVLLFDVYVLSKSAFFIGTYSSNLSRVIPCFIGFDNCKSLDLKWHIG